MRSIVVFYVVLCRLPRRPGALHCSAFLAVRLSHDVFITTSNSLSSPMPNILSLCFIRENVLLRFYRIVLARRFYETFPYLRKPPSGVSTQASN